MIGDFITMKDFFYYYTHYTIENTTRKIRNVLLAYIPKKSFSERNPAGIRAPEDQYTKIGSTPPCRWHT